MKNRVCSFRWWIGVQLQWVFLWSLQGQMVNPAPSPYWLAPPSDQQAQAGGVFRKQFEIAEDTRILKAIALVACDPAGSLILNGRKVELKESAEVAVGYDVGAFLKKGRNELEVRWDGKSVTPVLALRLELNGDGNGQRWVVTDETWKWFRDERENGAVPRVVLRTDEDRMLNPFDSQKSMDAYNSWKLALKPGEATGVEGFVMPAGFRAERVRSAATEEGSWIAMAFDRDGSLILARERRGLLRLTLNSNRVDRVRVVEDSLLECRGLVFVDGALFVNANNSKKLCRLVDANGDGDFEQVEDVLVTEGGVGHGRNHLKWGPDGWLYVAHGNNVKLPGGNRLSVRSAFRNFQEDQGQPCSWDASMFDGDVHVPAGHVLRIHPGTREVQLFAGGLRNPMDLAFNREGELFTFDADMEWDLGTPWYMPNRVIHVVSGGEYGFRRGTGRFASTHPDTLPGVVDIGLASPTAVTFGYGTKFPDKYVEALYVCDWAYGRILAVHLKPWGASYRGTFEDFVTGRPLNVTDLCVGPDGALWFITGGRGTQSGLYRIVHPSVQAPPAPAQSEMSEESSLRKWRQRLETLHSPVLLQGGETRADWGEIWKALSDGDRHIRFAARVALEAFDVAQWRSKWNGDEDSPWISALALARVGTAEDQKPIFQRTLRWARQPGLTAEQKILLLRIWTVSSSRHGLPPEGEVRACREVVEAWFPSEDRELNRLAGGWLKASGSPKLLPGVMELLRTARKGEDWLVGTFLVRDWDLGWSMVDQVRFLEALRSAQNQQGGKAYFESIQRLRQEFLERRTVEEREALKHWLVDEEKTGDEPLAAVLPRVRNWSLADLEKVAGDPGMLTAGSRIRGQLAFVRAQCAFCHRVGGAAGGQIGPDLAGVGTRFGRRDLLRHIVEPSWAVDEKFRGSLVELKDGQELFGMVIRETADEVVLSGMFPGGVERRILKREVVERRASVVSPMPSGLLDVLNEEEIGQLLTYLQSK